MTRRKKSFDPSFYELAEKFLSDTPKINTKQNKDDLAQTIQEAIEDWFLMREVE